MAQPEVRRQFQAAKVLGPLPHAGADAWLPSRRRGLRCPRVRLRQAPMRLLSVESQLNNNGEGPELPGLGQRPPNSRPSHTLLT